MRSRNSCSMPRVMPWQSRPSSRARAATVRPPPRSVLEKFAAMRMIDVHVPTTDGRELMLTRYTEPEPDLELLLAKLKLELPAQPPPKITATQLPSATPL